ncbi:MAG: MBOAT family O-acyltransferase [Myxococcota bacterium]
MLFNSLEFPVFLALVAAVHFALSRDAVTGRKVVLLVASYAFYASWNPLFVFLLAFSTAVDFVVGRSLARATSRRARRGLLLTSLTANLGLLGFFKYGAFFSESVMAALGRTLPATSPWLDVVLPVGISFYTLQSLSYTLDVYRGTQTPTKSALDFALYVSFFPQLVAGPIVRAGELLPQLAGRRSTSALDVQEGLGRIGVGLVKKVVLADTLALYADRVFVAPGLFTGPEVLLGVWAFTYQIYFDFSGYSDIAIGLARLFGVRLPENFDHPYRAASVREFWRRWHISLSTWLRDYLYVSLGGNRGGRGRTAWNLFLTMLIGGLWHGAAYGFLLWGAYHGLLLAAHRTWQWRFPDAAPRTPRWLRQLATFQLVSAGWIVFRAESVPVAAELVSRLGVGGFAWNLQLAQVLAVVAASAAAHLWVDAGELGRRFLRWPEWAQGLAYAALLLVVYLASGNTGEFIYFQF